MSTSIDKSKRLPLYTLLLTGIILCIIVAVMTYKNMSVQEETKKLSYIPQIGANVLVYYQDNEFYNDKTYYTVKDGLPFLGSIVDKVSIGYDYGLHYSDNVTGTYTAKITKTLIAYAPGSTEALYSTEPEVIEEASETYGLKDIMIQKYIDVNYQQYLNKYKAWAKTSKVSSDAKLIVKFEVINQGSCNSLKEINTNDYYTVSIPLTDTTFKISETTNIKSNEEVVLTNKNDKSNDEKFVCFVVIALCVVLGIVLLVFMIIVYRNDVMRESLYIRTLKKLITTYDNILVSVQKLPETKGLNVINVTSFDDLVDAQSEVRLPINYKEDSKKKVAKFILIRNDMAWVYTLKEGDLEDEKKA